MAFAALAAGILEVLGLTLLWTTDPDLGAANLIRGEQFGLTALWVFVPVAQGAAVASRQVMLRVLALTAAAVAVAPLLLADRVLVALLIPPALLAVAATLLPLRWARVSLMLLAGALCIFPLGYYVLPLPAGVLSLSAAVAVLTRVR